MIFVPRKLAKASAYTAAGDGALKLPPAANTVPPAKKLLGAPIGDLRCAKPACVIGPPLLQGVFR